MTSLLSDKNLKQLKSMAHAAQKVPKGTFIFREGQAGENFFIVLSGKFEISKFTGDGKELCLRLCGENAVIGELMVFSNNGKYLFNGRALEDSEVLVIKNKAIEQELLVNAEFALEFLKMMTDHFRKQHTKFRDLVLYGKKGALYSTLIRISNSYGVKVNGGILLDAPITHQELANFSSTSRESVTRELNYLKSKGIISFKGRKIIIHSLDYLKLKINCEGCPASYCVID
ncbi:Crp/Fnr family transcriptional regulator [Heyndrickxia ginsengihumi]|uniref:Crp/Fnr family transcriptional regulator n=1 Tax=Heyndrickxia ginsengihumi TaxID=363870 RepID=A0A0A6VAJ8_9BACI|nr:Crp/Fnr family transcriptional regulator [Heyndrickxia ginsengihumi]KHD85255.1 Crp/Fnr family transcriptional regulator [Heyndrickxia ginsengihumi]MBE6184551.1 Crp/Fnr family transcriptional regulator [Bacillus sp. (in: firmicutes)]MCM3024498.1 Crp/Fnr family transcriptional regulator [Heyndrickxia ginsengihumi]